MRLPIFCRHFLSRVQVITIALLTAAVIGATSFFSSCSNKNDDDLIVDGWPDPVTIDLSKVFTNGMPKEVDSMRPLQNS